MEKSTGDLTYDKSVMTLNDSTFQWWIDFLKDFSSSVLQSQNIDMFGEMSTWDEGSLRKILGRWHNAIQFMAPKASLKNTDSLLVDVADRKSVV